MLNKDIYTLYHALQVLVKSEDKLPAKVSFIIARNLKTLEGIVDDIDAARYQIVQSYGTPIPQGGYKIPKEKCEEANKELETVANIEIDVPLVKIKISDIENLNISIAMAEALMPMIEEEQ